MEKQEIFPDKVKFIALDSVYWDKRFREEYGDIDALADAIKEKGVLQPITVTPEGLLLAGHRRVLAAKKAGLTKIPALIRKIEGDIDLREIELMENIFRKNFTWSEESALIKEIDRLYKSKNIEWSQRKTAELLSKSTAGVSRAIQLAEYVDKIPELGDLKTADEALKVIKKFEEGIIIDELRKRQDSRPLEKGLADMIKLAKSNYQVGDVFLGLTKLKTDGNIDIIECDPPYGIDLTDVKRSRDSVVATVHKYNEIPKTQYEEFLAKLSKELYRVAGKNSWLLFWFGPTWHTEVKSALQEAGWEVDDIPAIWVKPQGQTNAPEVYLARAYEPFFICRKGKPLLIKRGRSNVFTYTPVHGAAKYHSTERPIELMEEILSTFGVDLQTVLVPFLGSGVTLRAAYKCGMRGLGWDISPEYRDKFLLNVEEDAKTLNKE